MAAAGPKELSSAEAADGFARPRRPPARRPPRFFCHLVLLVVAAAMIALTVVYVALIGAAIGGAWWCATYRFEPYHGNIYAFLLDLVLHAAALLAGAAMVFFMVKPLLAPVRRGAPSRASSRRAAGPVRLRPAAVRLDERPHAAAHRNQLRGERRREPAERFLRLVGRPQPYAADRPAAGRRAQPCASSPASWPMNSATRARPSRCVSSVR